MLITNKNITLRDGDCIPEGTKVNPPDGKCGYYYIDNKDKTEVLPEEMESVYKKLKTAKISNYTVGDLLAKKENPWKY